jgi:hypothetical protein
MNLRGIDANLIVQHNQDFVPLMRLLKRLIEPRIFGPEEIE